MDKVQFRIKDLWNEDSLYRYIGNRGKKLNTTSSKAECKTWKTYKGVQAFFDSRQLSGRFIIEMFLYDAVWECKFNGYTVLMDKIN